MLSYDGHVVRIRN